jgi:hypothetical protein
MGYNRYRHALFIGCGLFLAGCTHTAVAVCPTPVVYSPGMQAEAAEELLALPPGSVLVEFMKDYASLRARLRACEGG